MNDNRLKTHALQYETRGGNALRNERIHSLWVGAFGYIHQGCVSMVKAAELHFQALALMLWPGEISEVVFFEPYM